MRGVLWRSLAITVAVLVGWYVMIFPAGGLRAAMDDHGDVLTGGTPAGLTGSCWVEFLDTRLTEMTLYGCGSASVICLDGRHLTNNR